MPSPISSAVHGALLLRAPGDGAKRYGAFSLLYLDVPSFGNPEGIERVARERQTTARIDRSRATER